jgi:hypothetical protein
MAINGAAWLMLLPFFIYSSFSMVGLTAMGVIFNL